jgi:2-polyprenyl-6-methoxyphenol hydroxylase-like FAD-dependent oxidoreductase
MISGTHKRLTHELVVVIGGGIGGLATALALQQEGARVEVYERDFAFEDRKQGYGLTLTHNEAGPLAKLGVLDAVKAHDATASPSARHFIFAGNGALLGFYGNDFARSDHEDGARGGHGNQSSSSPGSYQRGNLRIPRQELRRVLLERLQPGTVRWGKKLEALEPIAALEKASAGSSGRGGHGGCGEACAAVRVRFADGSVADPAALVVASDGIRSVARGCVEPGTAEPAYTGIFIVLGLSPANHPLVRGGGFYTYDGARAWSFGTGVPASLFSPPTHAA